MKKCRQALSVLLAVIMLLCAAPLGGLVGLDLAPRAQALNASGTCGTNVSWSFNSSTGALTISGSGAMNYYSSSGSPFYNNTEIKSVVVQSGVTSIGSCAFYDCTALTSVTIPDSVTSIGYAAFYNCSKLTSVTIPNSVTSIGDYAFYYCSKLTSVTIPNSVTSIGSSAFYYCSALTSVTIPDSVTSIGSDAFYNSAIYNNASNWVNNVLYIGNHLIEAKSSISGSYAIKSGTKCIADRAFYNCSALTSVTIPDSVTSIGNSAFYYCSKLTSVTIGNSVTSIGNSAFSYCSALTNVTIGNSVTSIGKWVFGYCSSLTSVTIPDSVTSIGNSAFWSCGSLTSVSIPDSVTSIGDAVFDFCGSLTSVVIGNSVTSIGDFAFNKCTDLTSITIGNSVTSIGDYAFAGCTALESVTIPDSVTSIGDYAFAGCTALESVMISDSVTSIGELAFPDCSSLKDVYYTGSEEQWQTISIGSYNSSLYNATKHYNYFPEDEFGNYGKVKLEFRYADTKEIIDTSGEYLLDQQVGLNFIDTHGSYWYKSATNGILYLDDYYFPLTSVSAEWQSSFGGPEYKYKATGKFYGYAGDTLTFYLSEVTDENPEGTVEYDVVMGNEIIQKEYLIAEQQFDKPIDYYAKNCDSSTYDATLANLLCALSADVYHLTSIYDDYEKLDFGQDDYDDWDYYHSFNIATSDPLKSQYIIGFKDSCYNNGETICLITIRGSDSISDWIGNFKIKTEDEKHIGFSYPANDIFENIQRLKEERNIGGNIKYIVTGHSRGAAVANLLAVKLMETGVSKENVFAYTFACPDVACKSSFPYYSNIFNLCNYEDTVPFVPGNLCSTFVSDGSRWGKYGRTNWFNKSSGSLKPFSDHSIDLYLKFFNQRLIPSNGLFDGVLGHTGWTGWLVKGYCPVDVVLTDTDGNRIASVIDGEINYYDSSFGDVIIMTDGDKKAIFIKDGLDFNVELIGTDTGEMMYSVERYYLATGETISAKTFSNVALENGKQMYSPVSAAATTDDVELFVVNKDDNQNTPIYSIDTGGVETEIAHISGAPVVENETAATCDKPGSYDSVIYCTVCGEELSRETAPVDPLGHDFGEPAVTAAPTCTEAGEGIKTCARCGETETVEIPALGHDEAIYEEAASCSGVGFKITLCVRCGEVVSNEIVPALEHSWDDGVETTAATCTQNGVKTYTCTVCGATKTEPTDLRAHDWDDGVVTKAATCTEAGEMTYTCRTGGETRTEPIDKLDHTVEIVPAIAPTCTEAGATEGVKCAVCDQLLLEPQVINALGHTPDDPVKENVVEANCTEGGSYDSVTYCAACGEELVREAKTTDALGHTPGEAVRENEVAASCKAEGSYDEVIYCSECGEELSREAKTIDKLAHTPGDAVRENEVAATCKATGSYDEVIYCSECGEELSRETKTLDKLPHTPGDAVRENEVAATCKAEGNYDEVIYCSECGEELSRETKTLDKLAHTPGETVQENVTDATCSIPGGYDNVVYCTVCGEEISRETIADQTLPHTPGVAVQENVVDASCTAKGSYDEVIYCTACGEEISRETIKTDKLDHTIVLVPGTPATCSAAGLTDGWKCESCGKVFVAQETIAKLDHTPGDVTTENEVPATCKAAGSYDEVVYCTVCGEEISRETKTIAVLNHTPGDVKIENEVPATCTSQGRYVEVTTCIFCGVKISEEVKTTDMLPHIVVIDEAVPATCKTTGLTAGRHCTVCGTVLEPQNVIAKLDHTPGEAVRENIVDATYTTGGSYDEVVYCTACGDELSRVTVTTNPVDHDHDYVRTAGTEPTCTEAGTAVYACSICGDTYNETIPATGHSDGGDGYCATCGQDLRPSERCAYCGQIHTGFFGGLTRLFHNILAAFGLRK